MSVTRPSRTTEHRDLEAALDAWAGEHGFMVERLALDGPEDVVRLAPHTDDLFDHIIKTIRAGNAPLDWHDRDAAMDGPSPSWDWSVAAAVTYNRLHITKPLWQHDSAVRALFRHHGYLGTLEIQIAEVNPATVLHHLTEIKNAR